MKFGIVGILNTAIDVSLFFLLVSIGLPYWIAQSISYSGG
ncbi:MAG: GtrA family protein, partial [Anaerobacillus sp.]